MKSINVIYEEEDYEKVEKAKGVLGWKKFILTIIKKEKTGD